MIYYSKYINSKVCISMHNMVNCVKYNGTEGILYLISLKYIYSIYEVNQNVCLVINEVNAYIGTLGPLQVISKN